MISVTLEDLYLNVFIFTFFKLTFRYLNGIQQQ